MLKLRIVVNGNSIYEFREGQPVIIPCTAHVYHIMVTNGFHHSRVLTIYNKPGIHFYEAGSYIDNVQLMTGLIMTLLFFLIYIFSGILFFLLFANIPLFIMLYIFYLKKDAFILLYKLDPGHQAVKKQGKT